MRILEDFLRPTQEKLFRRLKNMYRGKNIVSNGEYILVKGTAPIMLVAHLDTVHKNPVKVICKSQSGNILMSPQGIGGDDRCGVYALACAYDMAQEKPWLLFTCDEETGGGGAMAFVNDYADKQLPEELNELKMIVEIDRKGNKDAVYYQCANAEFEEYITGKGFKTAYGTFSDISIIAPTLGVAAVNLSAGYYNAHTNHEYINRSEINAVIKKVVEIIADTVRENFPRYEYVEDECVYFRNRYDRILWDMDSCDVLPRRSYVSGSGIAIPKDVPRKYVDAYDALLDCYSLTDIEEFRKYHGNEIIRELYEATYGCL